MKQATAASRNDQQKAQVDERLVEAARKQNEREAQLSSLLGKGDARGLKLVGGSVSETTFHEAVRENMDVFGVSKEQAIQDVVKEFKLMGIDISDLAATALSEDK